MIVIKIELWPAGFERYKKEIGRMEIVNDGSSQDPKRGNYDVRLFRRGSNKILRDGKIEDHARKSATIWKLVRKAIDSVKA